MSKDIKNRIVGQGLEDPANIMLNPENWRVHTEMQKQTLQGALEEIGWIQQVILNKTTGRLVDGHLRVELAVRNKETEIPVVYVELSVNEEKIALATIDPISALAETDQEKLDELIGLINTENDELLEFLATLESEPLIDEEPGAIDDDEMPDTDGMREGIVSQGEVWILGDHRLMCGDSTKQDDVNTLMDGEKVDMVWTDPPYNVDYEGGTGMKIDNDNMDDAKFRAFLTDAFKTAAHVCREGAPIYIAHADSEGVNFRQSMQDAGFMLKQCLIWVKNSLVLGRQDYQWKHEPILYGWKPGAAHKWYGEFDKTTVVDHQKKPEDMTKEELEQIVAALIEKEQTSVIRHDKPTRNDIHPTMKPVGLVLHMLRNSSSRGDIILDLFGGGGSTLIASQKIGRHARMMELSPGYSTAIINRFQEFSGIDAYEEKTGETFDERK